eukprot:TRINITY_DN8077_c0_g1_i1.p1 TRINITY_DN8077_c0_g1~~TRINITY_DN8077_c0_g1_i1.p1  ORF type:complete len:407 (-),score=24.32 TRINITY_DN8077_c0_g1_i1:21-1208(-)
MAFSTTPEQTFTVPMCASPKQQRPQARKRIVDKVAGDSFVLTSSPNKRRFRQPRSRGGPLCMDFGIEPPLLSSAPIPIPPSSTPEWEDRSNSGIFSEDSLSQTSGASFYLNEFEEQAILGRGCFGHVTKALKKTDGLTYAVKKLLPRIRGEMDRHARLSEVRLLARCSSPYIVRYYSSWVDDGYIFLQTEYCSDGDALALPRPFWTSSSVHRLLNHIGNALAYLHRSGMAHLDVKSANFLVSGETFKLADFGCAISLSHSPTGKPTGRESPFSFTSVSDLGCSQGSVSSQDEGDRRYLAPEFLHDKSNCPAADAFGLGISSYELCTGLSLPEYGGEWHALRHGREAVGQGLPPHIAPSVCDIICQLMEPSPALRLQPEQLLVECERISLTALTPH